ncbi:MAG: hypothetical protein VX181_07055 [Pseudomonadota bacterium]|nr:hypothetical protein [Pseudomonadota bacterium]
MAVEIVMVDEEDRPGRQAKVNLVDYLRPMTKPVFRRLSQRG